MHARLRPVLLWVLTAALAASTSLAGEGEEGEAAGTGEFVSAKAARELEQRLKDLRPDLKQKKEAAVAAIKKEEDDKFAKATAPNKFTVTVGEKKFEVTEPRSLKDVEPLPSDRFRIWSLWPVDFVFDLPLEIFVPRVVGPDNLIGKDKVYFVLPFSVANSLIHVDIKDPDGKLIVSSAVTSADELAKLKAKTEKDGNSIEGKPGPAPVTLQFTMITDKGVFTPEASGFLAHEAIEFSTFERRAWAKELVTFLRQSNMIGELKAGETRSGVAVFPRFDPEATQVRILVDGLTNQCDFAKDLRKALILEFERPGNVYYPGQVKLAFRRRIGDRLMDPKTEYVPKKDEDVHHGFDWVWLWNWDVAASTSDPKCSTEVASPTGDDKFNFWTYRVKIPNRTGMEQPLTVEQVRTFVKVKIDVAGKERTVEVPLVDDGKMNVYKASFFEAEANVITSNRFPKGLKVAPGADPAEFLVCFRERDIDFAAVLADIHNQLDLEVALDRNAKDGDRGKDPFKQPPQLSAAEVASVRDQLAKKVHDALVAQLAENVSAELTVRSDLSSGTRVVNFSLYKPAPLPPPPQE